MISPWSYDINGRTWTNDDFNGYLYIKNRPALIGDLLAQTTAGPTSTSTSSITIGTGSKSFTIGTGVPFIVGAQVRISRQSDSAVWMNGVITAYNNVTGAITVNVEDVNGSGGPFTDWNIQLSGKTGAGGSGVQNKFDATTAPTTTDDIGAGYSVGSVWIDVTNDLAYVCVDATSSAAVWLRTSNLVSVIDIGGSQSEVSNTTAEQTIVDTTIPANTLTATKAVKFWVGGSLYNNTGSNVLYTIEIIYGTTTLWKASSNVLTNGFTGGFSIVGHLHYDGGTTAQSVNGYAVLQRGTSATTGSGGFNGSEVTANFGGTSAEDSTAGNAFKIKITMDTASANAKFQVLGHVVKGVL